MGTPFPDDELDQLFRRARSYKAWDGTPISEAEIRAIYDLAKWGPTATNVSPARFTWVVSEAARARLLPHVAESNRPKMDGAAATVIVAYDLGFGSTMAKLAPHAVGRFDDLEKAAFEALRSGTLQGAYLIMSARALGWDCGPMGGVDRAGIDAEFFAGTNVRSNFIIAMGRAADGGLKPRAARLDFDEACHIL
jgi:nitroreductase